MDTDFDGFFVIRFLNNSAAKFDAMDIGLKRKAMIP